MGNEANRIQEITRLPLNGQPTRASLEETSAGAPYSLSDRGNSISRDAGVQDVSSSGHLAYSDQEPISNPLALLADASDAARALECPRISPDPIEWEPTQKLSDGATGSLGHRLLHRPGYVSLGLRLDRRCLEHGLDTLLAPVEMEGKYSNYFNGPGHNYPRDVGPDLDPVDLGLVTMDEVSYLFPM